MSLPISSIAAIACTLLLSAGMEAAELTSPDGSIRLQFKLADHGGKPGVPVYQVSCRGESVITESRLGLTLKDGPSLQDGFRMTDTKLSAHDSKWQPPYGERREVRDQYRQLDTTLDLPSHPGWQLLLSFRCHDSGVAFRYQVTSAEPASPITIKSEQSEFLFTADHNAWASRRAQTEFLELPLSKLGKDAERPLTIEVNDNLYVALGEASLVDFARMKFRATTAAPGVLSTLAGPVRGSSPLRSPWRVIMLAASPGQLLENNDIFLNLNQPCQLPDTSWIKPGKVIREVTLTTTGAKACVDFAKRRKLQYIEFDAGWYGHENDNAADATTVTLDPRRSKGPLDLAAAIRYARERNIGVILYVNRRALETQLDEILPLYQQWGVSGLKYGFVQVGSQQWTAWLHDAVRKAAEHRLMVDIHDEYRPTGYSRTFPNLMTQEGIRGDECQPSNRTVLTTLFTRMLAGAGDHTVCYFWNNITSRHTRASQLAKAVCIYSPWQFLYWYDCPSRVPGGRGGLAVDAPELEFYDLLPTVWDDTRVLHGAIGDHAVIARKSGDSWFIGAMTAEQGRELEISLDFLDPKRRYQASIYHHDPSISTPTQVRVDRQAVDQSTRLSIKLPANDGQAIHILPANASSSAPPPA